MTSYIIDKNLQITGNLTIYGSIINIMTEFEYNNYDKKNVKSITDLIGFTNIYNNDLIIENDLICTTYNNIELIVNGSIISQDIITLNSTT